MMKRIVSFFVMSAFVASVSTARADIFIFDITANPAGWAAAVSGMTATGAYNFGADPDYGILGFPSPLTSAGGGPVSAGNLHPSIFMNEINNGGGTPELVAVGPLAGFGNAQNAVLANFFVDAFNIGFNVNQKAFEFTATSLLGSGAVTITGFDQNNNAWVFAGMAQGVRYGLIADGNNSISSVSIFDVGGGAEGVQGDGIMYQAVIPEPGSLLVLSTLVIGCVIRRRVR